MLVKLAKIWHSVCLPKLVNCSGHLESDWLLRFITSWVSLKYLSESWDILLTIQTNKHTQTQAKTLSPLSLCDNLWMKKGWMPKKQMQVAYCVCVIKKYDFFVQLHLKKEVESGSKSWTASPLWFYSLSLSVCAGDYGLEESLSGKEAIFVALGRIKSCNPSFLLC